MIPCLVIGDSIAIGIGQYLPECRTEARVGVSSRQFVHTMLSPQEAGRVVISLGVNDGPSPATIPNLRQVRRSVQGAAVYWLLPASRDYARNAIKAVAAEFGDRLIDTAGQVGSDGLHPTGAGYRSLARLVDVQTVSRQPYVRTPTPLPGQIAQVPLGTHAAPAYWLLPANRDGARGAIRIVGVGNGDRPAYAPAHVPVVQHPTGSGLLAAGRVVAAEAEPRQPGGQTVSPLPGQIAVRRLGG